MKLSARVASILLIGWTCCPAGTPLRIDVGEFSKGLMAGWQTKAFKGRTDYRLVGLEGRTVLKAVSEAQASGLYRKLSVDLNRTPFLNWSWRIDKSLGALNEKAKGGDDYPARVYVVVSGGVAFWRTRSVNYVWASSMPQGQRWPNAYAGEAVQMLALRSGDRDAGIWMQEKRNVREDLKNFFGEVIDRIDAVALMSDTDNSGCRAVAYYGDIYFSDH
jgi:hypothetical protein